jgi:steroid delta-isomerase-like uncharacterized protein
MTEARQLSDRYVDLINAHDAQAIGALYADDAVLSDPSGEFRGREAIVQYWEGFFRGFPDLSVTEEFKAEGGDTAITEWTVSGTNQGPLETPEGTIPATGKRVTISGSDGMSVDEERITSHRVYYDQLTFLTQLGLVPETAAAG